MLPDMDGYEVCTRLRDSLRTSHIPIIFFTQKDERSDQHRPACNWARMTILPSLLTWKSWGLRVQNALRRASYESLNQPDHRPPQRQVDRRAVARPHAKKDWALLYLGVSHLQPFNEVYGFVAGADVLRFLAMVLPAWTKKAPRKTLSATHGDDFIIITPGERALELKDAIKKRFDSEVATFYSFRNRENGYLALQDGCGKEAHAPLMTLAVGIVTSQDGPFSDIRQITEIAAEARRSAQREIA